MDRREENQEIGQAQSLRFLSQLISLAALPLMRALSIALPVALILAGCVGGTIFSKLDQNLAQGDCAAAITLIDKSADRYGSNAQLLYLLVAILKRRRRIFSKPMRLPNACGPKVSAVMPWPW